MTTKLEHKVRNPKKLDTWLDIWTADNITINADNSISYIITPSSKWEIPVNYISGDWNLSNTTGSLPLTNINGIDESNNNTTKFLRQDGQWVTPPDTNTTYTANKGITLTGTVFEHTNNITPGTAGSISNTQGSTVNTPYITYDEQGHIKNKGTYTHTINNLDNSSIADNAGIYPSKILQTDKIDSTTGNVVESGLPTYIENIVKNNTNILNTRTQNGIVKAVIETDNDHTNDHTNEVWASDDNSNPGWRKITNDQIDAEADIDPSKINTKLLGAWIDDEEPALADSNNSANAANKYFNNWDYNHLGIWIEI